MTPAHHPNRITIYVQADTPWRNATANKTAVSIPIAAGIAFFVLPSSSIEMIDFFVIDIVLSFGEDLESGYI
jgi:hypothetical protein